MQTVKRILNATLAVCIIAAAYGLIVILRASNPFRPPLLPSTLTAAAIILGLATLLVLKPPRFATRPIHTPAVYPTRRHQSDVTILVSVDAVRQASTHPDPLKRDWSFEWENIVAAAVGPHSIIDLSELASDDFKNTAVLVLTKSASANLDRGLAEELLAFMRQGGVIISEGMSALVSDVLEVDVAKINKGPIWLDHLAPELVPDRLTRAGLAARPFYGTLWEVRPRPGASSEAMNILASSCGRPCIVQGTQGNGHLVAILFDLAAALVHLKQGFYPRGLLARMFASIRHGWGWPKPAHLIPRLSDFRRPEPIPPLQEVLADAIFRTAARVHPFGAVSRLPAGKRAFLAMTHDEDYASRELSAIVKEANERGVAQTVFLLPDCRRQDDQCEVLEANCAEIGFHWNRFRIHLDRKGIHVNRYARPADAIDILRTRLLTRQIASSRIHWLSWDTHPGTTFATLAGAGLDTDSSQGAISTAKGYIFATGYGYRPLSPAGAPISLLEVPYEIEDDLAGADVAFMASLIELNINSWHSGLVILIHPWECTKRGRLRNLFDQALKTAERDRVWATTLAELHAFRASRERCEVSSTFAGNILKIEIYTEDEGLCLHLPSSHGDLKLSELRLDGDRAETSSLPDGLTEVALPRGRHTITLTYS